MSANAYRYPVRLATAVYACLLTALVLLGVGLMLTMPDYSRTVADRALDRAVQIRTRSAAMDFARSLHADWTELSFLAGRVGEVSLDSMRAMFDGVVGSGQRVSWIGFAGLDGRVVVASGGLLEGVDVSARPWFEAGLRGGFAGDVHDAVLLNRLLGGDEEQPVRFIDFARPVDDVSERETGVLSVHIDFGWAERFLAESAAVRGLDLFLVNAAGDVIFGTDALGASASKVQALRAAAAGVPATTREVWPDGKEYFASVVPAVTYADLPPFGWRLVGRVPSDAFEADRRDVLWTVLSMIGLSVLVFMALGAIFTLVFVRPIERLVTSAERISKGEGVYPEEYRSTAESYRLSSALARIESRLPD